MLIITLITLIVAIPLTSVSATLLTRITFVTLIFSAVLSYNNVAFMPAQDAGLVMYSGLIQSTTITQYMEVFMLLCGALILLPWSSIINGVRQGNSSPTIMEYPMIILFTTLGGTFLMASADLVSMYLAIELQSFGVYILSAMYRDSESATSAGLKYFLLGALSSALILLGSALVYGYTGLTNLNMIFELLSVPSDSYNTAITLGFIIISIGLLFKVASAPFHYWAIDVYDGTPTIVTTWLTVMPKISIFVFMLEMYAGITNGLVTSLLLICAFLSLIIGTVLGLGQFRIKRLLAYSTISHVGFILLALAVSNSTMLGEESLEAFLFYIVQYSITNIDVFFVLLAFGYLMNMNAVQRDNPDVEYITELRGQFMSNPVLGLSLAICLFSMAGVPPLVGFFAKYNVLYSAIHGGYLFMAILAILASVVSAAYYLRVIRVVHFEDNNSVVTSAYTSMSSVHCYIISVLTLFIMTFAINPELLLNSTSIMALSIYTT